MPGRPKDPDYWKKWRAAHPEYRQREVARSRARKQAMTPDERRKDRGGYKPKAPVLPLPPLFPLLQRGAAIAFWDDELRMDLAQERALAELEGKDPDIAAREYGRREMDWFHFTVPISPEGRGQEGSNGSGSMDG